MSLLQAKIWHALAVGMYYRDSPVPRISWDDQDLATKLHWQAEAKRQITLLIAEARLSMPFPAP